MNTEVRDAILQQVKFTASPEQLDIIEDESRWKLIAGGVRAGKSRLAAIYLLLKLLDSISDGTARDGDVYWLVAADYERTRAEFNYLATDLAAIGLLGYASKPVNPGEITLSTSVENVEGVYDPIKIKTKSASDFKSLAMEAPIGIVCCEASQIDLESFWRLQERLVEKRGWLLLEGTFESSLGWYPERYSAWQTKSIQKREDAKSFSLPTWTNTFIFPGGREDPEIKKLEQTHSEGWFLERFAGVPSPPRGRVHDMFRNEIHLDECDYIEGQPVFVWVDPGYSRTTESAYAVAFAQIIDGQIRVFDEIYEREKIGPEIVQIAQSRPWWGFADKRGAIDRAGTQHQAMPSQTEVWLEHTGLWLDPVGVRITEGIERFNTFLRVDPIKQQPGIVFDPICKGVISELGGCPNPFDGQAKVYSWATDREGNVIGSTPRDRYNHAVKAITYGLISEFGYASGPGPGGIREAMVTYF